MLARIILPDLAETKYAYAEIAFTVLPDRHDGHACGGHVCIHALDHGIGIQRPGRNPYQRPLQATLQTAAQRTPTLSELAGSRHWPSGCLVILIAIVLSVLQGFNIFDIMFKAFGALLPATALPILAGFFWKKISARGAMTGLIVGAISGVSLVVLNIALVNALRW